MIIISFLTYKHGPFQKCKTFLKFYKLRALYMNSTCKYTEFCKTVINLEVSVFISLGQSQVTNFTFIMSYVMDELNQVY